MSQTNVLTPAAERVTTHQFGDEQVVIPVIEETLSVGKRVVERGGVRIVKSVVIEEATIEEPTIHEAATVERVPVNRLLAAGEDLPKARQEGDTLIIPLFEEVIVTEKRMRVTEELRVLLTRTETVTPQTTTIRRETVRIEPISSSEDLPATQD